MFILIEYMDDWEKFSETSEKEEFYSHLNKEDITDDDYTYAKRVCKDFEIKNLGEYHDLYVQRVSVSRCIRTFKICVLKYMNLILQNFFQFLD